MGYYIVTKIQFFIFPFLFSSSMNRRRQPAVFAFVGQARQPVRARCIGHRYFPYPLGIVTSCDIEYFCREAPIGDSCTAGQLSIGHWVPLGIVTTIILGILLVRHIYRALKHCTIQHSSAAGGVHRGGRAVHGAVIFVTALRRSVSFCYSVHYRQLFCGSKISAPPLCRFLSDAPRARVLTTGDWLGGTYACERSES